jgi:conjugal transfer pilus assembly protein TraV
MQSESIQPLIKSLWGACIFSLIVLTGCATVLNPYEEHFSCPDTPLGKCGTVGTAYEESKSSTGQDGNPFILDRKCTPAGCDKSGNPDGSVDHAPDSQKLYEQQLYKRLVTLIEQPVAPLVEPPKVMRILFLPYKTKDNHLNMPRYTYVIVGDPTWILAHPMPGVE